MSFSRQKKQKQNVLFRTNNETKMFFSEQKKKPKCPFQDKKFKKMTKFKK